MSSQALQQGAIVRGALLPETVEVPSVARFGASVKIVGRGLKTGLARDLVLTPEQVAQLEISGAAKAFDGDARLFRLGVEASRLGLAYEYDPYFSLSIARIDPRAVNRPIRKPEREKPAPAVRNQNAAGM